MTTWYKVKPMPYDDWSGFEWSRDYPDGMDGPSTVIKVWSPMLKNKRIKSLYTGHLISYDDDHVTICWNGENYNFTWDKYIGKCYSNCCEWYSYLPPGYEKGFKNR